MEIEFFEKTGCINNTKQKKVLERSGHTVLAFSLLDQAWTAETLRPFFGDMPVEKWFNMSSPRIKNGEIDPRNFNEKTAIEAMLAEPLLIRRPLLRIGGTCVCGFDNDVVNSLINNMDVSNLQNCPNVNNKCD